MAETAPLYSPAALTTQRAVRSPLVVCSRWAVPTRSAPVTPRPRKKTAPLAAAFSARAIV